MVKRTGRGHQCPEMIDHLVEPPLADNSVIPTYFVFPNRANPAVHRLRHGPDGVRMEVFGRGNRRFYQIRRMEWLAASPD